MSEELEQKNRMEEAKTENAETEYTNKTGSKKKKFIVGIFLGLVCVILIGGYCLTAVYYREHFFPGTMINGIDYGNAETAVVASNMMAMTQSYQLSVMGRDSVTGQNDVLFTVSAQDAGMHSIIPEGAIAGLLAQQNEWGWPSFLWNKGYTYSLNEECVLDEALLATFLASQSAFQENNMKNPENAYIKGYSDEEEKFVLVPEVPGTRFDKGIAQEAILSAMMNRELSLDLEKLGCYTEAAVKEDDTRLQSILSKANKCLGTEIVYDWNGNEVILNAEQLKDWITIEGSEVLLDEEAVKEFVNENAKAYDTYGKDRKFVTAMGVELTLPSGAYGWRTDREAEAEELTELIKSGTSQHRDPVYANTAAWKEKGNDIGKSYVEADMSHQHLYLYQDGELVLESDFVSGNVSKRYTTPPGVFGLTYKTTNAVLRGADYETPVNYWMPFNGNIGMHDATWRGSFGGKIYLTNGSHGCINLPLSKAKEIYQYVEKGFPVVCYYYSQEELDALSASSENGGTQSSAPQSTPQVSAPQENTPQVSAPQESTPAESEPQESTPAENEPQESTPAEDEPQESTPAENEPQESTPVENESQESTQVENEPQEGNTSQEDSSSENAPQGENEAPDDAEQS